MLCMLGFLFVTAVVCFEVLQEIGAELAAFRFRLARASYLPMYYVFWMTNFMALIVGLRQGFAYFTLVLFSLPFLMLCYSIISRPYSSVLDNIGIIFNYALIVSSILYVELRNRDIVPSTD